MNLGKPRMLLIVSILSSLLGLLLFNSFQAVEPVLARIAPTITPKRITPTAIPRRRTPADGPYKVFLPFISTAPLDSFTLINMDLEAGVIEINQATTYALCVSI